MGNGQQTDKERILGVVVNRLMSTTMFCPGGNTHVEGSFGDHVHFAYYREPKAGDLVLAQTGAPSAWQIAWYVEKLAPREGGAVVREIGTGLLCNYSNESFIPIVGMYPLDLLEGEEYKFYQKTMKAFRRGGKWQHKFKGIEFRGSLVKIWIRNHIWVGSDLLPYSVEMEWDKRTTIKAVLAVMVDGGYGTREFEKDPRTATPQGLEVPK